MPFEIDSSCPVQQRHYPQVIDRANSPRHHRSDNRTGGKGVKAGTRNRWSERNGALMLAGLAGTLSIALGIAGVLVDQMETFPGTNATAGEITGFVQANTATLVVAMLLNSVAVSLWLAF